MLVALGLPSTGKWAGWRAIVVSRGICEWKLAGRATKTLEEPEALPEWPVGDALKL